ncbi:hypothetical protein, partial [Streptomyces sp. NPDC006415]|uniref:hypothetical protein n=1 Tax=Streptomyces sp. NPDC006415 TaxID=3155351 RepID=UPI0033A53444
MRRGPFQPARVLPPSRGRTRPLPLLEYRTASVPPAREDRAHFQPLRRSRSGTFVFAGAGDPGSLDPALASDGETFRVTRQAF